MKRVERRSLSHCQVNSHPWNVRNFQDESQVRRWHMAARLSKTLTSGDVLLLLMCLLSADSVFQAVPALSHFKLVPYVAPTGSWRELPRENQAGNAPSATFSCGGCSSGVSGPVGKRLLPSEPEVVWKSADGSRFRLEFQAGHGKASWPAEVGIWRVASGWFPAGRAWMVNWMPNQSRAHLIMGIRLCMI